jgi:hypothetical protein
MKVRLPPQLPAKAQQEIIEQLSSRAGGLSTLLGQQVKAVVISSELVILPQKVSSHTDATKSANALLPVQSKTSGATPEQQTAQQLAQSASKQFNLLLQIGSSQFSVRSETAMSPGSQLLLKVNGEQQLQIISTLLDVETAAVKTSPTVSKEQQLLQSSLRAVLPYQQEYSRLLRTLVNMPTPLIAQLSPQTQQAVARLLQHLPTPDRLQQAQELKQAILNSGLFLEAKMLKAGSLGVQNAATKPSPVTGQKVPDSQQLSANKHLLMSLIGKVLKQQGGLAASQGSDPQRGSHAENTLRLPEGDFKADIARLVNTITTEQSLNSLLHNHSISQNSGGAKAPGDIGLLLRQLAQLIKAGNSKQNSEAAKIEDPHTQVKLTLLRQALSTLSRTQLHQLNTLQSQSGTAAENPLINSWNIELPVMNGEKLDTFFIEINEEEASDSEHASRQQQWRVMLSFELDGMGTLYVQLVLIADCVSATIWADNPQTLKRVEAETKTLREGLNEIGVNVKQLECQLGTPPNRSTRLEHQLIDLHT